MGVLQKAINGLTERQLQFLADESGLSADEILGASEEKLDELYDLMCDIEVAETPASDNEPLDEHCELAASIVTVLGNAIAEDEGLLGEMDLDDEE